MHGWLQDSTCKNFCGSLGVAAIKQLIANVQVSARSIIQCYLRDEDAPVPNADLTCAVLHDSFEPTRLESDT